jgi:hypothetical protein
VKPDPFVKALLLLTTLFLGLIALRPLVTPPKVRAQSEANYRVYIEPGTTMLITPDGRQNVIGKVVVDLRNGKIWGFPTLRPEPYPRANVTGQPPVVSPIYLGRYNFGAMTD